MATLEQMMASSKYADTLAKPFEDAAKEAQRQRESRRDALITMAANRMLPKGETIDAYGMQIGNKPDPYAEIDMQTKIANLADTKRQTELRGVVKPIEFEPPTGFREVPLQDIEKYNAGDMEDIVKVPDPNDSTKVRYITSLPLTEGKKEATLQKEEDRKLRQSLLQQTVTARIEAANIAAQAKIEAAKSKEERAKATREQKNLIKLASNKMYQSTIQGLESVDIALGEFDKAMGGTNANRAIIAMQARFGKGQGANYYKAVADIADVTTRIRTGAALNKEEMKFYGKNFGTNWYNDPEFAKSKLELFKKVNQELVQRMENPRHYIPLNKLDDSGISGDGETGTSVIDGVTITWQIKDGKKIRIK